MKNFYQYLEMILENKKINIDEKIETKLKEICNDYKYDFNKLHFFDKSWETIKNFENFVLSNKNWDSAGRHDSIRLCFVMHLKDGWEDKTGYYLFYSFSTDVPYPNNDNNDNEDNYKIKQGLVEKTIIRINNNNITTENSEPEPYEKTLWWIFTNRDYKFQFFNN
jgi:hypothetical protein